MFFDGTGSGFLFIEPHGKVEQGRMPEQGCRDRYAGQDAAKKLTWWLISKKSVAAPTLRRESLQGTQTRRSFLVAFFFA